MQFLDRLKDDAAFVTGILRALKMTTHIAKNPTRLFPNVIEDLNERYGDQPALLSQRERFSYRTLAERSNRYSRWALGQRVGKGEVVTGLLYVEPESHDLCTRIDLAEQPLNQFGEKELCPGSSVLEKINAELR